MRCRCVVWRVGRNHVSSAASLGELPELPSVKSVRRFRRDLEVDRGLDCPVGRLDQSGTGPRPGSEISASSAPCRDMAEGAKQDPLGRKVRVANALSHI